MSYWLFKEEPSCYSYEHLERDGETTWDGISNALALIHLRKVQPGDDVLFYQTGQDKAIVGIMRVTQTTLDAAGKPAIQLVPVRKLRQPITLAQIKADPVFETWELVRISRLSVMPVPVKLWKRIEKLEQGSDPKPTPKKKG